MFISLFSVFSMILACTGYGLLTLRAFGAIKSLNSCLERATSGFIIGIGVLGWLLFFPGIFGSLTLEIFWTAIAIGVIVLFFRISYLKGKVTQHPLNFFDIALYLILAFIAALDLIEAISPAADADTLAYHFALPRDFIASEEITFVARAVTGAIPLLVHMTYAAALSTGGELALTLWTATTGWAPGIFLYAVTRRRLDRTSSLLLLALFLTTPAILYGGGSGQIEIRCAGFVLCAGIFLLDSRREASYRLLALAGICAGFFIGAKYYGLIFAGSIGVLLLCDRDRLKRSAVFTIAATLTGFQWYMWNYIHTGDPVFPVLMNMFQLPETSYWSPEFGKYFTETYARADLPLERTFVNWLLYPIYSIFNVIKELEGGRTGLGVLSLLILPAAIMGVLHTPNKRVELLIPWMIAAIFFTVWFFSGTTQRTRHILPIYPLILLTAFPAAISWAKKARVHRTAFAGIGAVLVIQLAGHSVFSANYATAIFNSETRLGFLSRNLSGVNAANWINKNLGDRAKIGFTERQLAFLIEIPSFMLHPHEQATIDVRPTNGNEKKFINQSRQQGLTHLLLAKSWVNSLKPPTKGKPFNIMLKRLVNQGCLKRLKTFASKQFASRTLSGFGGSVGRAEMWIYKINYQNCP